jgi:hypothetical protein
MSHRDLLLWCSTLGFELVLCVLVYARGLPRRLPFFSSYVTLLLLGTLGMEPVYLHFGFRSAAFYYADWITTGLNAVGRGLAIAELCHYGLRAYRGVWALAWRILSVLALISFGHAAFDAWGQPGWIVTYVLTLDRDVEFTSVLVLIALLLIRRYYALSLEPLEKWIAAGICLFCVVDAVNKTMLRDLLSSSFHHLSRVQPEIEQLNEMCNTILFSAFIVSMSIWCFALRKPLPAPAAIPQLLPAEVYEELSPAVNLRLRAFNDRLLELLKP